MTGNFLFFRLKFVVPRMMAVYNSKQEIRNMERYVIFINFYILLVHVANFTGAFIYISNIKKKNVYVKGIYRQKTIK